MARAGRGRGRVLAALTALAVALAVAAPACTDDDSDDVPSSESTVPAGPGPGEPSEISDGCGDQAATDPSDLSADRVVARCGPGSPEASPLPARTPLRVAVPAQPGEEQAPVLLAERLGAFEDENLAVEIVEREPAEAMADLASGRVDVVVGPLGGAFLDSVHGGSGAKAVLGGAVARSPNKLTSPQSGLWLRRSAVGDDNDGRDLSGLQSQPVGLPGGAAGPALYPLAQVLGQRNVDAGNMSVVDVSGDDAAERLENGELAAAWLDGASWLPVAGDSRFDLLATLPATESIDGTVFSRRLTGEARDVGLAYVRAVTRTINTHLTGDYQPDDDVVDALALASDLDEDTVTDTRPLLFDWEIRDGTLSRIEDALLTSGGVTYESPQPTDGLVDRTLAADAVGAASR